MNRFHSFLKSRRVWGLTGTAIALYILIFGVFGRLDMSWFMPNTTEIARTLIQVWPRLPFFAVQKQEAENGKGQEIYYTVPTRQLTQQELTQMGLTNRTVHPVAPK